MKALSPEDIRFFSSFTPGIPAGSWVIRTEQTLAHAGLPDGGKTFAAEQPITVAGPRVSLPVEEILGCHPPRNACRACGHELPHVVLRDATIPWGRRADKADGGTPWLALILLREGEDAVEYAGSYGDFDKWGNDGTHHKPALDKEQSDDPDTPCCWLSIGRDTFLRTFPGRADLPLLAHCRQMDLYNKAEGQLDDDGVAAVVIANAFPQAGAETPICYRAHLVSLEGLLDCLPPNGWGDAPSRVAVLSLYRWTFFSSREEESFQTRFARMLPAQNEAEKLLLRFPAAVPDPAVNDRMQSGYLPLTYRARTGEEGVAWYRGPLTPAPVEQMEHPTPFFTGDAAMILDREQGVFDMSLAGAWEAGRLAALADKAFGEALMRLRREGARVCDLLLERMLTGAAETDTPLDDDAINNYFAHTTQEELRRMLDRGAASAEIGGRLNDGVIRPLGEVTRIGKENYIPPRAQQSAAAGEMNHLLARIMQCGAAPLNELLAEWLDPLAAWLGKLLLLTPVPFDALVADERMLPAESLRFFYLDPNWQGALFDGALSLGVDCSRQDAFNCMIYTTLWNRAKANLCAARSLRFNRPALRQANGAQTQSGLLLHSRAVEDWPNLEVHPLDKAQKELPVLRMERLSPQILLCLFGGVPETVEFREPVEGMLLGTDAQDCLHLRTDQEPFQEAATLSVAPYLRDGRTLRLTGADGLLNAVSQTLHPGGKALNAAAFALQLMHDQECIVLRRSENQ